MLKYQIWIICWIFVILYGTNIGTYSLTNEAGTHQIKSTDEIQVLIVPNDAISPKNNNNQRKFDEIYLYFLRGAIADFNQRVSKIINDNKTNFTRKEIRALNNTCKTCNESQLKNLHDTLTTILAKYPILHNDTSLQYHLLEFEDQVKEYLDKNLKIFLNEVNNRGDIDTRKKEKKERTIDIMSILNEWFENKTQPEEIQKKLIQHLKQEKRYWRLKLTPCEGK